MHTLTQFLLNWGLMTLALWVASYVFRGISFQDRQALVISALLLGLANAVVRPLIILFTLPLTLLTFGLFLLVINALMILFVAYMVKGFRVSGFWTAFFASIFISIFNFFVDLVLFPGHEGILQMQPMTHGILT